MIDPVDEWDSMDRRMKDGHAVYFECEMEGRNFVITKLFIYLFIMFLFSMYALK